MKTTTDQYETIYPLRTPVRTSHRPTRVDGEVRTTSEQPGYLVIRLVARSQWDAPGVYFRTNGGTWGLPTLLGLDEYSTRKGQRVERLSIDFGQEWTATNMVPLIDEMLAILATLDAAEVASC